MEVLAYKIWSPSTPLCSTLLEIVSIESLLFEKSRIYNLQGVALKDFGGVEAEGRVHVVVYFLLAKESVRTKPDVSNALSLRIESTQNRPLVQADR